MKSNQRKLNALLIVDGDEIEVQGKWKRERYIRADRACNIRSGAVTRFVRGFSAVAATNIAPGSPDRPILTMQPRTGAATLKGVYRNERLVPYSDGDQLSPVDLRIPPDFETIDRFFKKFGFGWDLLWVFVPVIGWIILFMKMSPTKMMRKIEEFQDDMPHFSLNDGDAIEVKGSWLRQEVFKVKRLRNKTTGVEYEFRNAE